MAAARAIRYAADKDFITAYGAAPVPELRTDSEGADKHAPLTALPQLLARRRRRQRCALRSGVLTTTGP